jgi:hypothetical protein
MTKDFFDNLNIIAINQDLIASFFYRFTLKKDSIQICKDILSVQRFTDSQSWLSDKTSKYHSFDLHFGSLSLIDQQDL